MEGLHVTIEDAIDEGVFKGVKVGRNDIHLSHLCYADDGIIFGDWENDNLINMVYILSLLLSCLWI